MNLNDDLPNPFDSPLGGIPIAGPPPPNGLLLSEAPFSGAFPNEEGASAFGGIPPPPNGLLLSGIPLDGALPKADSDLGGIPGVETGPTPTPFIGAFPNAEGAVAFVGIPPPPNGLLLSAVAFGGDVPNDLGVGGGPESFSPPTNPFCEVFSKAEGMVDELCLGGDPNVPLGEAFPNAVGPDPSFGPPLDPSFGPPLDVSLPFKGV